VVGVKAVVAVSILIRIWLKFVPDPALVESDVATGTVLTYILIKNKPSCLMYFSSTVTLGFKDTLQLYFVLCM